jgi:hypothetical protein
MPSLFRPLEEYVGPPILIVGATCFAFQAPQRRQDISPEDGNSIAY